MPTIKWNAFAEYDELLRTGTAAGQTAIQMADDLHELYGLDVTENQVSGRISRLKIRDTKPRVTPEEKFYQAVQAERMKTADRALAREMASAVKAQARWAEFIDIVEGELVRQERPATPTILEFPKGSGTPEIFVPMVGDIHIGKLVDPQAVGDDFGYNRPVFEARWTELQKRLTRYYVLHSQTAPFSEIRFHFMGDGVDGVDMRRGHGQRVDIQTATQQVLVLVNAWEWLLRSFSAFGVPVNVIWDYGNHGRVGEFGVNLPADNWDYIAGEMLKLAIRDVDNVKIHVATQKYHVTELGPYKVYSSHGDGGSKGGNGFSGIPINSLARNLAKDTGLHKQVFDLYLTAHYHTPQDITTQAGRILMNGSWDGGDDYSINQLKVASEPVQLVFGVHPERGITWKSEAQLAPRRTATLPEEI